MTAVAASPRSAAERRCERLGAAALAAVVLLAYAPTLWNGLVWDDVPHLLDNSRLRAGGAVTAYLLEPVGAYYRPAVFLGYTAEHALWGSAALGYHLTNVALHVVNTLLLIVVARRTGVSAAAALFGAAVFALHPVQSEAVAYVSGRTDLLMTTGALLSCAALLGRGSTFARGIAAAVAGVLAMLSKESGEALVVLWFWFAWRREGDARDRLRLVAPGTVAALLLLALRPGKLPVLAVALTPARLAGVGQALLAYLGVLVWPAALQIDRLTPLPVDGTQLAIGLLVCGLALGAMARGLSRRSPVGDWSAWTGAFYLPVANVIALYPAIADRALFTPEHNLYAPLAGIGVLSGIGAQRVAARLPAAWRRAAIVSAALLMGIWATITAARCTLWHDEERLFGAAVADGSASPRVWYDYGNALLARGAVDDAAVAFEGAAERGPNDPAIWANLGVARQRQRSYEAAERAYRRAVDLAPRDAQIYENLGTLYVARGDLTAARAAFATALQLDPQRPLSHRALTAIDDAARRR